MGQRMFASAGKIAVLPRHHLWNGWQQYSTEPSLSCYLTRREKRFVRKWMQRTRLEFEISSSICDESNEKLMYRVLWRMKHRWWQTRQVVVRVFFNNGGGYKRTLKSGGGFILIVAIFMRTCCWRTTRLWRMKPDRLRKSSERRTSHRHRHKMRRKIITFPLRMFKWVTEKERLSCLVSWSFVVWLGQYLVLQDRAKFRILLVSTVSKHTRQKLF